MKKLSDILDLSPRFLKEVSPADVKALEETGIQTIRDLSKVAPDQVQELGEKARLDLNVLDKVVVASKLIARAWRKRKSYEKTDISKIAVVGLDNAGKSSLIAALSGREISEIVNQEPTTMVNQVELSSQKMRFVMWDFGGQVQHRQQYLENPENYFLGLDHLMFVVDTQDPERYDEAIDYFTKVLDVISYLRETPFCQLLLHKADPDLMEDPEFVINLEYLDDKLREVMKSYPFAYEVVKSSIYKMYQDQPLFAQYIKDLFKVQKKDESSDSNLMVVDAMMKVTEMVVQIGNELATRLDQIRADILSLKEGLPPGGETTSAEKTAPATERKSRAALDSVVQSPSTYSGSDRGALMDELKEMFKKRRLLEAV
ncbi:MAG: ADP-ribosylation factor-like protein [Promethearchaeota archaeon]